MVKFYYAPGSISLAVHIMLEMSGLEYESIAIDFSQKQQRSESFLAINPLGRVPALETEHGVISEALAILNYIDARVQSTAVDSQYIAAKSVYLTAQVDAFNAFMASTVHVAHAHLWRAERWVDSESAKEDMAHKVPQNLIDHFSLIEEHWLMGDWVQGGQLTSSDLYLFTISRWLKADGVEIAQFKKVHAHFLRMAQLKPVETILNTYYS
jgi:glutathione S-transferase